jgi:nucleotide-binding universal stress UspA family protein
MNQSSAPAIDLIEPSDRHRRIVVGIDGSEASVSAMRRAVQIATALGAPVEALSSWRMPTGYTVGNFEYSPEEDARAMLSGATKSVFGSTVPKWFSTATFEGAAADVLVEQSTGAQMLVVGSRGHGGIAGLLIGSVSARCAERANCPVLIIH